MRVIGGKFKGFNFPLDKKLVAKPTTDRTKEALFEIIENKYPIYFNNMLELFAGTGNMGIEFLSRNNLAKCLSIDRDKHACNYMIKIKKELLIENWRIENADVIKFINSTSSEFDLIFADPPYDMPNFHLFVNTLISNNKTSLILIEHQPFLKFNNETFIETRSYGKSCISFFGDFR